MGYAKIYEEILESSVWAESYATRIMWTSLLVMADRDGNVRARALGIAKRAGVTLEEARTALAIFLAPDPNSKSSVAEGRRMVETSTGYLILNYEAYRDRMSEEERKEGQRERQRRSRERREAQRLEAERIAAEIQGCHVTGHARSRSVTNVTNVTPQIRSAQTQTQTQINGGVASAPRIESGSGVNSPRQESDQIQIAPAAFDAEAAWKQTKEVWGNAGTWPGGENLPAAREKFDAKINAANWAEFLQGLDWAVTNSQTRRDRKWLGVLCTFLDEEKWKEQSNPYKAAPAAPPPPPVLTPEAAEALRIANAEAAEAILGAKW